VENSVDNAATYQITIDASAEHVLATLRDVAAYPDWQQSIVAVDVLAADDSGRPTRATMTLSTMGMRTALTLALEHDDATMRWSLVDGDAITRNDAEYRTVELADGRTELRLRQELSFKWKLPEALTRPMIERTITSTMEALRKRAEQTATSAAG
jgi:ribosome-associated toxin RatA of RatAB toxin-antitoxin module